MNDLAPIVEAKSGSQPVSCDAFEVRLRLGYDVGAMRASGYDSSIIAEHESFNARLERFTAHPQFGRYLGTLTPQRIFGASGVRLLPLDAIRREIQELAPGARLFPHGYMPFATSIGGNVVCFHAQTGRVVWADHDSFGSDGITYKNRCTGEYHTVPFAAEQIEQALVPLASDFETFVRELLQDSLQRKLDELD